MRHNTMKLHNSVRNFALGVASIATLGASVATPQKVVKRYANLVGMRGLWNDFANTSLIICNCIYKNDA